MTDSEGTTQAEEQEQTLTLEGLQSVLASEREAQSAEFAKVVDSKIEALRSPDRSVVTELGIGNSDPGEQSSEVRVSRNQPTDPLYRNLYNEKPAVREFRNADRDHWIAYWIRGLTQKNREAMAIAGDRLAELSGRNARAETLEGDVSGTALLDGSGGHLLPQEMASVVSIARDNAAVLPGVVQNFQMTSATLRIPTAGAASVAMIAEGSAASADEPTFATDLLKAQKCQVRMRASIEMLADSPFNLVNIYTERAGTAIGAEEDTQICTSDGAAPNISEAISGGNVAETTGEQLAYADVPKLYFSVGKAYRPNAVWLGGAVVLELLSGLKSDSGQPTLSFPGAANVVGDVPGATGTIFGRPVYEVPLASGRLIFGDPASYAFGRRDGIVATVSDQADFASDLVSFKFTERFDGRILDTVGLKQFSGLATLT